MSCRPVYHKASVMFICIFTRQINGWMEIEPSKELKEKLLSSDREGLGTGLWLGIRIADLNQIADLKLSILAPVKFRSPI